MSYFTNVECLGTGYFIFPFFKKNVINDSDYFCWLNYDLMISPFYFVDNFSSLRFQITDIFAYLFVNICNILRKTNEIRFVCFVCEQ